jgi:hypothetical protein
MTPLYFDSDRETIDQAALSLVADGPDARSLRILHIRNTLDVARFAASSALLPELRRRSNVTVGAELRALEFASDGSLVARAPS